MLAPYSFLAKRCMPAPIWAQSKRRSLMERKQRMRFSPPDNRAAPQGVGRHTESMSALPPKADIDRVCRDVRLVPKADIKAAFGYYCWWARVLKFVEHHP